MIGDQVVWTSLQKNLLKITSQEEQSEHQSRGVYLRDDHCDWGSSGMNEFTEEFNQKN